MTERNDDKPFLSRWSERKRAAGETPTGAREAEETPTGAREAEEQPAASESQEELEANRAAAEAIDIDSLTDQSDYTPFFRPGVPAALKSVALRKLWRSNPVFAVLDGLNDYDEDFTVPTSAGGMVRSAWKVGRGFLEEADEKATEERAAAKPTEEPTAPQASDADEQTVRAQSEEPPPDAAAGSETPAADDGTEPEAPERPKVGLARRLDLAAFAKQQR